MSNAQCCKNCDFWEGGTQFGECLYELPSLPAWADKKLTEQDSTTSADYGTACETFKPVPQVTR